MNWWQRLLRKHQLERQVDNELRYHIERLVSDHVAAGMSEGEARRKAHLEFGGLDQVKEECRDTYRANYLENLAKDIRYGLRMLQKSPSFTFFAVAVLALGIAANSAIFSIADNVLVRPLPYGDSNRLVIVWEDASAYGFPKDTPAPGNFADLVILKSNPVDDIAHASDIESVIKNGVLYPVDPLGTK